MARRRWLAVAALLACGEAPAHSFGKLYNLPVPLWMYTWGAAAALAASFVVVGWFVSARHVDTQLQARRVDWPWLHTTALRKGTRLTGVLCLLLAIAAGFVGTSNPYANISMTLFWIGFVLVLAYASVLLGDIYGALNPWRTLADGIERLRPGLLRGRAAWPQWLGVWPALALYIGFIAFELFGHALPYSLALALSAYTVVNLGAAWWFGCEAWFSRGELFAVLFSMYARMAPLARVDGELCVQQPFAGALRERASGLSMLVFVLFMLSSTAYDGIRDTVPWSSIYWKGIAPMFTPWVGTDIVKSFPLLRAVYHVFQYACLIASPFLYLGVYVLAVALSRRIAGGGRGTRELALDYAYTLLPIVLVYHLAHYYTLVITQGSQIVRLVSDPFGRGWNLFGTAGWLRAPIVPDAGMVWHTQVWLIVAGHVVSVYLAHLQALRIYGDARTALRSQLPMLALMVGFTTLGLWILAQPIQTGQVIVPVAPPRP